MPSGERLIEGLMRLAIDEARASLREGNNGFGAIVAADGEILGRAHDREITAADPTAHAELDAIRLAAQRRGRSLAGCVLVATHEPCPMCATAAIWAGIDEIAFGYSIEDALAQGRRRIPLGVRELVERAGVEMIVRSGLLADECRPLYDRAVRTELVRLRDATTDDLGGHAEILAAKRLAWCDEHPEALSLPGLDPLQAGYELLLRKLDINPADAPIVERGARRLVFHSRNFCPTLEACRILGEDTTRVCRAMTELPAAVLVARADPRLRFSRNYARLRPTSDVCEELITIDE